MRHFLGLGYVGVVRGTVTENVPKSTVAGVLGCLGAFFDGIFRFQVSRFLSLCKHATKRSRQMIFECWLRSRLQKRACVFGTGLELVHFIRACVMSYSCPLSCLFAHSSSKHPISGGCKPPWPSSGLENLAPVSHPHSSILAQTDLRVLKPFSLKLFCRKSPQPKNKCERFNLMV